jgi:hypothetical protein
MERVAQCHCGQLRAITSGEPDSVYVCHCIDLLHLDGEATGARPLLERIERLRALLSKGKAGDEPAVPSTAAALIWAFASCSACHSSEPGAQWVLRGSGSRCCLSSCACRQPGSSGQLGQAARWGAKICLCDKKSVLSPS